MSGKRILPSVAMKQEVEELLHRGRGEGLPLSEFIRTAARSCLQEAVEQEVTTPIATSSPSSGPK